MSDTPTPRMNQAAGFPTTDWDKCAQSVYDEGCKLERELAAANAALAEAKMPDSLHPETKSLVRRFASALAEKLAAAEKKYGYSDGWRDDDWMHTCRQKLAEHLEKGDPRDVAAYCAFLWHHGQSTAPVKLIEFLRTELATRTQTEAGLREQVRVLRDALESRNRDATAMRSLLDGTLAPSINVAMIQAEDKTETLLSITPEAIAWELSELREENEFLQKAISAFDWQRINAMSTAEVEKELLAAGYTKERLDAGLAKIRATVEKAIAARKAGAK